MKQGMAEAAVGGTLATTPLWGNLLDQAISGAHVVAAFGGAIIAIHGLLRIARNSQKRRRKTDPPK